MKLHRLAVLNLLPAPDVQGTCSLTVGSVRVATKQLATSVRMTQLFVQATTAVQDATLEENAAVLVPSKSIKECEAAISRTAELLAIAGRCRHEILTATPPCALEPETEGDRALLQKGRYILAPAASPHQSVYSRMDLTSCTEALNGRWLGGTLLAEAYAHTTLAGRFRDFVRLFELAFSRAFTQMDAKLAQTLAPGMGYTREEIRTWQALRHPFTHADGKLSSTLAFESDARKVIYRMEQAALDILFNKADWGKWSSSRRDCWRPDAMTVNSSGQLVVRQGSSNVRIEWLLMDEFGTFPRISSQHADLPSEWFCKFVPADGGPPHPLAPSPSSDPIHMFQMEPITRY
jgi:hypothetical protein